VDWEDVLYKGPIGIRLGVEGFYYEEDDRYAYDNYGLSNADSLRAISSSIFRAQDPYYWRYNINKDSTYTYQSPIDNIVYKTGADSWSLDLNKRFISKIIEDKNGDFYLLGTVNETDLYILTKGAADIFVIKVSKSGVRQWTKTFGGSERERFISAQLTPSGDIHVKGISFSTDGDLKDNSGNGNIFVFNIDLDGQILYATTTEPELEESYSVSLPSTTFLKNKSSIISTNYGSVCLDDMGNYKWSVSNNHPGISTPDYYSSALELDNGNILFSGIQSDLKEYWKIYGYDVPLYGYLEVTPEGEILWAEDRKDYALYLPDGTYYTIRDSFIQRKTTRGDLIWQYNTGLLPFYNFYSANLILDEDGGVVYSSMKLGFEADTGFVKTNKVAFKLNKSGERVWTQDRMGGYELYKLPNKGYLSTWSTGEDMSIDFVDNFINRERDTLTYRVAPGRYFYQAISIFKPQTYCPPTNILPDSMVFCPQFSTTLSANEWEKDWVEKQALQFNWSTGATTSEITITTPGTYRVTVTMNDKCTVEDEVVVIENGLNQCIFRDTIETTVCFGEAFQSQHYYEDTAFSEEISGFPMDTIRHFMVNVISQNFVEIDTTVCLGHELAEDRFVGFESSTYEKLVAQNGCDSITKFQYKIIEQPALRINETICFGDTLFIRDTFFVKPGIHTWNIFEREYCDSSLTVELRRLLLDSQSTNIAVQPGELFHGIPIFRDTNIVEYFENRNGCDSIVNTQISVSTSSIEEVFDLENFHLFPNPVSKNLNVEFKLKESAQLDFKILDGLGKEVLNLKGERFSPNARHQKSINLPDLSSGVYILQIISPKGILKKQFFKE